LKIEISAYLNNSRAFYTAIAEKEDTNGYNNAGSRSNKEACPAMGLLQ
jgi:hypothetical protein